MKVLVVDDAPDIRLLVRHVLELGGLDVAEAPSGRAALLHLASEIPDVIVLDIQMPEMDGWATLAAVREHERARAVPVILCSVKSRDEDRLRGWHAGCDGYISKPFDVEELLSEVLRVAEVPPAERDRIRSDHIEMLTKQLA